MTRWTRSSSARPPGLHPDQVVAAAEAGKHVFCEKPMAMSVAEAERMAQACDDSGVLLQIGFVRHFCNEWLKLRELIQSGAIGRPVVWRSVSGGSGAPTPWFFEQERSAAGRSSTARCTTMTSPASHSARPAASAPISAHMKEIGDAWDTGTAVVDFDSGDQLIMCWSWGLPGFERRRQGLRRA
jgi:hypothetical protein